MNWTDASRPVRFTSLPGASSGPVDDRKPSLARSKSCVPQRVRTAQVLYGCCRSRVWRKHRPPPGRIGKPSEASQENLTMKLTRREALGGLAATLAGTSLAGYFASEDI